MADMRSFNNRYRRYLEDEADTYLKPKRSTTDKLIMGGVATVGLLGGGLLAFKSGALKDVMHSVINQAGKYRRGRIIAANNAIRSWSEDQGHEELNKLFRNLVSFKGQEALESGVKYYNTLRGLRTHVNNAFDEHEARVAELTASKLRDKDIQMKQYHDEMTSSEASFHKVENDGEARRRLSRLYEQTYLNQNNVDIKEQELRLKQTGYRHATIQDLIHTGEFHQGEDWIQQGIEMAKRAGHGEEHFLNKVADQNILINAKVGASKTEIEAANIADIRDFRDTFDGVIHSLTTDFTIPIVKINPLRMFYLDHFFNNKYARLFHVSTADTKNPLITGHNGEQGKPLVYADGKVYDMTHEMEDGSIGMHQFDGDFFLADAQKGPVARLIRNMSGISISKFNAPEANAPFMKKLKYNLGSFFDVGLQDEPMGEMDIFDPTSWVTGAINLITGRMQQKEYVKRVDYLSNAFGHNKDFIYMRKHKTLEQSESYMDYLNQFVAGRTKRDANGKIINEGRDMSNVTLSTLFPYAFFERLNATINQVGLGLSNKALGSAFDVFGNLMLKRVAPIWAGFELWDYMNYESENLVGFQMEDAFANMYKDSSIEIAKIRDNLGITNWAKGVSKLLVGGSEIAEIPILGNLLTWNKNEDETKDYWENGEVPVRKGRWWPIGNTPFIGEKPDHYEPNWVRRTLADVKFSESQYGSRDEYFANSWMPTLRHPFAPIRHFLTDPYHWEEKHYQDRPYMVTGGIPEIENFPLIGPLLNETVGQVLKPTRQMHPEAWNGNGQTIVSGDEIVSMPTGMQGNVGAYLDVDGNVQYEEVTGSTPKGGGGSGRASSGSGGGGGGGGGYSPSSVPINTKGTGYGGISAAQRAANKSLYAYVTASGGVSLLEGDEDANLEDALNVMKEKAPMSTGQYRMVRSSEPEKPIRNNAGLQTQTDLQQMLGNLHYNMSEMGGFYGFMGTSITGEIGDQHPILQSSSDISSYTRAFWDKNIGGMGGDANEIFRRFLPADRKLDEINPVRNTMPTWLPGSNYFTNFQTGDPYTKVMRGEYRLPGEGYERLYHIDSDKLLKMPIGASFIGYDEHTIRQHILHQDAYKEEAFQKILNDGSKVHADLEKELTTKGIVKTTEQYVNDEKTNIGGFYDLNGNNTNFLDWAMKQNVVEFKMYQRNGKSDAKQGNAGFFNEIDVMKMGKDQKEAYVQMLEEAYKGANATIDIKTRGAKAWAKPGMHFENVQQLNFYATQMGTPINYFLEVNRQDPKAGIKIFAFQQNPELLNYTTQKVENVREGIRQDMASGKLNRGDLYNIIDRYRILADVAPYSQEFRDLKASLSHMGLSDTEHEEVQEINHQMTSRKHKLRFYNYRFKTANVDDQLVTVDHVLDNNTFVSVEHPDNPIRFAGLRISQAKDNPIEDQAMKIVRQTIRPGEKLRISVDADELNQVKDDTYKTIQAVVYDHKGRNINKYLIDNELAKEKDNDYSPAAVHARFTPMQIAFGSLWETFAHMDTMIHTKLLQVRSPLESYERREVYGKDWQEWTDPIDDFLIPAIQTTAVHHPLMAIATGAFIGASFGSLKPTDLGGMEGTKIMGRYGKIVGGFIGASVMGIAVLNRIYQEHVTGKAWIPERRQKERDTEEYFDVLKYIKYNKLFNEYADLARRKEGFDVKKFIEKNAKTGEERKAENNALEKIKRQLYSARPNQVNQILSVLRGKYDINAKTKDDAFKQINAKINANMNHREMQQLSPISAQALKYYQSSKQTLYGYNAGDPMSNVLAALPKKDRDYLVPFMNAPEEDRKRILDVVPNYMRRVLQSAWGLPVDEKLPLAEYFGKHPLPGANWKGWREDTSLDDIKVKFVDKVGLDPSEFNMWPDDFKRAEQESAPAPNAFGARETAETYSRKIKEVLTGFNVHGVQLDVVKSNQKGIHVEMNIDHDRRDDVQKLINQEGHNVM
jgi:endonuclease YncB( thermonuclease family)